MVPVQRAAVPAVISELVLALPDPLFGSLAYGLHQVWVALAQLALLVHQARNVVADNAGTQRSDVPITDGSNTKDIFWEPFLVFSCTVLSSGSRC